MVKDDKNLRNEIIALYSEYKTTNDFDFSSLESKLYALFQSDSSEIETTINYCLLLLSSEILDYDLAYSILSKSTNDIRSKLLCLYIEYWYYGLIPSFDLDKYLSLVKNSKEKSCLYYFASLSKDNFEEKIKLLEESLHAYGFNFLSVIELIKANKINKMSVIESRLKDLYMDNALFISKINKTKYIDKILFYKPFLYSKLLGLSRDEKNIKELYEVLFS